MNLNRKFVASLLMAVMVCALTGCPESKKLAPFAEDVVEGLSLSLPLLEQAGVDVAKVRTAIDLGRKLVIALKSEGGGDPVNLVDQLIGKFDLIVGEVNKLPISQANRTKILVGLAVSQIALRIIARNIEAKAPEGVQEVSNIKVFAAKPKWRCRSSQTGRFAEMKFCREHPDVSVVETY